MLSGGDPSEPGISTFGEIAVWNLFSNKLHYFLREENPQVNDVAISPGEQLIASANCGFCLRVYDADSGKVRQDYELNDHYQPFFKVVFSYDGRFIAAASIEKIFVWDCKTGRLFHQFEHETSVCTLVFSPVKNHLYSFSIEKGIVFHDVSAGSADECFQIDEGRINCIAISSDGHLLFAGGGRRNGKLWCWDLTTHALQYEVDAHDRPIKAISNMSDNNLIATSGADCTIAVWEIK